jgi:hypothetical protein
MLCMRGVLRDAFFWSDEVVLQVTVCDVNPSAVRTTNRINVEISGKRITGAVTFLARGLSAVRDAAGFIPPPGNAATDERHRLLRMLRHPGMGPLPATA